MVIEQTIDIPPSRRLFIDVPQEVPVGRTILTFTPASANNNREARHDHSEKLKAELQNLHGSLGKNAFGGLDGITYQQKIRGEWNT